MRTPILALLLSLMVLPAVGRDFAVYPIGKPQVVGGLKVGAVYFQPVDLEGGLMHPAKDADIHLEADIQATANDPDGYAEGDWRPFMTVGYRLTKIDGGQTWSGPLAALVAYGAASIGKPHYGDNLKLAGPGRYRLHLSVRPPEGAGVGASLQPVEVEYTFVYAGVGKRGAY